jgi:phenylacetic acid degradation operon negative regulatory protein
MWSLSTDAPHPLRASTLVERACIFDIDPAAVRVALGRLVREGSAIQVERGVYQLGPAAEALHAKARGWADVEDGIRPWSGDWTIVLTHHLGRTDRPRMIARERALRLTGFAAADAGLWVRPDNLRRNAAAVSDELHGLGLDPRAKLLTGCRVSTDDDGQFRALWPKAELEDRYRYWIAEMEASATRVATLSTRDAARETFLLGQSVIRAINSDPLLPVELIDASLRSKMIVEMSRYNITGLRCWAVLALSGSTA